MSNDEISDYSKSVIERTTFLRGSVITGYAQVEQLLINIVMRCRKLPEYSEICRRFPYRLEDRIKTVRRLFAAPGPLHQYRPEVEAIIDGISEWEEHRHFMAHGLLIVTTNKSDRHDITMRMYRPLKGGAAGDAEEGFLCSDLTQLEQLALDVAEYSNRFVRLFGRIYLEQELEAV